MQSSAEQENRQIQIPALPKTVTNIAADNRERATQTVANAAGLSDEVSHKLKKRGRNKRLKAPKYIQIAISHSYLAAMPDGRIRTVFLQGYTSDALKNEVYKTLILSPQRGDMKITSETTLQESFPRIPSITIELYFASDSQVILRERARPCKQRK